ncbi:hypothetical protein KTJ85_14280 [Bacillus sp. 7D3]|nr:hypothetical protein KEF49_14435 [Bacillus amyloliquefaciens]QYM81793.1 hypothetical protein KTJ85_14280 [Bacillus sp. 7D3]QZY10938.1 hypothetical protein K7B13_14530 [Bacillus amyloliquefaciens]
MAIIPMRQTVTVTRASDDIDVWGNPMDVEPFDIRCRIDEGSTIANSRSSGVVKSEEVVATARILVDKLADIRYTDTLAFTNELGETIVRKPKEINVKRHVSGKPILTEVVV